MLTGAVFATRAAALAHVAAIGAALGPTEEVREPSGALVTVPRAPWAVPMALADGRWLVPWKPRIARIAGRGGLPRMADLVPVTRAELASVAEEPKP